MKNFEMPKMNISIFSVENVVTTSGGTTPAAKTNTELAKEALAGADAITVTTANDWIGA